MVDIKRPDFLKNNLLPELLRWNKHTTDNIDALKNYTTAATVEVECVHGVESAFDNVLSTVPRGFLPLYTTLSTGVAALPVAGTPILTERADGRLGLTVSFAPPPGVVAVCNSATQAFSVATATAVLMGQEDIKTGVITHSTSSNTSRIVFGSAGIVRAEFMGHFTANATAGQRYFWMSVDGLSSGERWGNSRVVPTAFAANNFQVSGSGTLAVAAGTYLELFAQHSTGVSLDLYSGASDKCRLAASYIAPPAGYTATVTGILLE